MMKVAKIGVFALLFLYSFYLSFAKKRLTTVLLVAGLFGLPKGTSWPPI